MKKYSFSDRGIGTSYTYTFCKEDNNTITRAMDTYSYFSSEHYSSIITEEEMKAEILKHRKQIEEEYKRKLAEIDSFLR